MFITCISVDFKLKKMQLVMIARNQKTQIAPCNRLFCRTFLSGISL